MSLINYLTKIHFADGVLQEALQAETGLLSITRPLVVTDRGVEQSGLLQRLLEALGPAADPVVFNDTPSNPTEAAARSAAELYSMEGCDGIVAFGGGSSIDLAKAAGLSTLLSVGAELATNDDDRLIQAIRNGGQDTINDAGQQIIRRQLNIAPTLTIRPGFPVRVIVTRDLILEPYGG